MIDSKVVILYNKVAALASTASTTSTFIVGRNPDEKYQLSKMYFASDDPQDMVAKLKDSSGNYLTPNAVPFGLLGLHEATDETGNGIDCEDWGVTLNGNDQFVMELTNNDAGAARSAWITLVLRRLN